MAKTNTGLVKYCKAQKGKPYWFGTYGQKASKALYNRKKKQYPKYYKWSYSPSVAGKKVHDCAGLIKGYLWSSSPSASPKYNAKQDYGATGFYNSAKKKGTIKTFKKIAGQLVFKGNSKTKTHVGVYIGNNYVIEAKGHKYGVVQSKFSTGGWKYWAQCHLIKDDTKKATASASSASTSSVASSAMNSVVDEFTDDQIEELNPVELFTYRVIAQAGLRIREEAGMNGNIIACMNYGSECFSDGTSKNVDGETWLNVSQGDHHGWSCAKYLQLIE